MCSSSIFVDLVSAGTVVQNALGERATMAYDSNRLMTSRQDVRGNFETITYTTDGLPETYQDQRGLVTTYTYDGTLIPA